MSPLLIFDERPRYGSRKNYFHFLWGYLLPALDWVIKNQPGIRSVGLETCAPKLDIHAREAFAMLGVQVEFFPSGAGENSRVRIPRWDHILRNNHNFLVPMHLATANQHPLTVHTTGALLAFRSRLFPKQLKELREGVNRVQECIVPKVRQKELDRSQRDHLTILRRSPPTNLSTGLHGASASNSRSLMAVEEAMDHLVSFGRSVSEFEPGAVSLSDQITKFSAVRNLVAMRGAELGNLIWMEPGARVLILSPVSMRRKRTIVAAVASYLNIDLRVEEVPDKRPILSADLVLKHFPNSVCPK